jgi:hypothetical protein
MKIDEVEVPSTSSKHRACPPLPARLGERQCAPAASDPQAPPSSNAIARQTTKYLDRGASLQ